MTKRGASEGGSGSGSILLKDLVNVLHTFNWRKSVEVTGDIVIDGVEVVSGGELQTVSGKGR